MQIVIDIPDYLYKVIQECKVIEGDNEGNVENVLVRAVENGVVLPKGHGKLKDADAICKDIISALGIRDENYLLEAEEAIYKRIKNAPTIIEADKGRGEE